MKSYKKYFHFLAYFVFLFLVIFILAHGLSLSIKLGITFVSSLIIYSIIFLISNKVIDYTFSLIIYLLILYFSIEESNLIYYPIDEPNDGSPLWAHLFGKITSGFFLLWKMVCDEFIFKVKTSKNQ